MSAAYLVPATRALLEGWQGPVVAQGCDSVLLGASERDGLWLAWTEAPWAEDYVLAHLALDTRRAEARDRIGRVLTRDDDHPEGSPVRVQWDAGRGCWEMWWLAETLETRDVVYDLGVPWAALEGLTPEDEHAALAAVARAVLQ